MKHFKKALVIVSSIALVVSIVLFVTSLWWAFYVMGGYQIPGQINNSPSNWSASDKSHLALFVQGQIFLGWSGYLDPEYGNDPRYKYLTWRGVNWSPGFRWVTPNWSATQYLGFNYADFRAGPNDRWPCYVAHISLLWPIAIFAILPARALWLYRKKVLRSREGCCKVCGYDLRATPDRCPECGTVVPRSAGAT